MTLGVLGNIFTWAFIASWYVPKSQNRYMFAVRAAICFALVILDLISGYFLLAGGWVLAIIILILMMKFWLK